MSVADEFNDQPQRAAYCPNCGSAFGQEAKFCAGCGQQRPLGGVPLGDPGESSTVVSAVVPAGRVADDAPSSDVQDGGDPTPDAQLSGWPMAAAQQSNEDVLPTLPAAADITDLPEAEADESTTPAPKRSRKRLVITSVAAATTLGLLLGGVGIVQHQKEQARLVAIAQSEQEQRDQAAAASATFLDTRLAELGAAADTAAVRAVAATAATHKKEAEAYTLTDDRTVKASAAIATLATLSSLSGDTLGTWPQLRAELDAKLQALAPGALRANPATSLAHVDALVAAGEKTLAEWQMQVAVAERMHSESLAAVNQYNSQVQAQISRYNQLREEAADWDERTRSAGSYSYSGAVSYFELATSDRRAVRDSLSVLTVPSELRAEHNELLSILTEAVDGIQNLVLGLQQNHRCYSSNCYLDDTSGYQEFERKSAAITKRYGDAVDSLNYSINQLTSVPLQTPAKPEV